MYVLSGTMSNKREQQLMHALAIINTCMRCCINMFLLLTSSNDASH